MDLVITTSPIIQEDFIDKAIHSVSHINFHKRFIICDGTTNENIKQKYSQYKDNLKIKYPAFEFIEWETNKWIREGIKDFCKISTAESIFCIQHDTLLNDKFCPHKIWNNKPSNSKILYFCEYDLSTKKGYLQKRHHWFPVVESYNEEWFRTLGWSERVFIFDRQYMIDILDKYGNGRFIETICNNQLKRNYSDDKYDIIWDIWKCYAHKEYRHTHLVGKTLR